MSQIIWKVISKNYERPSERLPEEWKAMNVTDEIALESQRGLNRRVKRTDRGRHCGGVAAIDAMIDLTPFVRPVLPKESRVQEWEALQEAIGRRSASRSRPGLGVLDRGRQPPASSRSTRRASMRNAPRRQEMSAQAIAGGAGAIEGGTAVIEAEAAVAVIGWIADLSGQGCRCAKVPASPIDRRIFARPPRLAGGWITPACWNIP